MSDQKRILALGAHPDDIELGCGGTLKKMVEKRAIIRAIVFSDGAQGATENYDRRIETRNALEFLGINDVVQFNYTDTRLSECSTDIIRMIENECKAFHPDRVYTMFKDDRHQDHRTIFEASIIACRKVPQLLCYETPSSWPNFIPLVFEPIHDYLSDKVKALKFHVSQKDRLYMQEDRIRGNAVFRGQQVGLESSEGFIPYKMVM